MFQLPQVLYFCFFLRRLNAKTIIMSENAINKWSVQSISSRMETLRVKYRENWTIISKVKCVIASSPNIALSCLFRDDHASINITHELRWDPPQRNILPIIAYNIILLVLGSQKNNFSLTNTNTCTVCRPFAQ